MTENIQEAISELGEKVYNHLLNEMKYTKEELDSAIAENRLLIDKVEFIQQKDGSYLMTFDASINKRPNNQNKQLSLNIE
jgi:Ni,Fe-hydrogenase III component G